MPELVAAFNAGFLMSDANGGYYTDNKTIVPLRTGGASFVVYKNGSSTVGQWGRDVTMDPTSCPCVRTWTCSSTTAMWCRPR